MKTSVTRAQWLATTATSFQSDFDHDIVNGDLSVMAHGGDEWIIEAENTEIGCLYIDDPAQLPGALQSYADVYDKRTALGLSTTPPQSFWDWAVTTLQQHNSDYGE